MSTELTKQETEKSLTTKENNLLEKFTTANFHKMTTRAGHEDFSMVTIDDARMNQIASNLIL
jgi:hypothetical protein